MVFRCALCAYSVISDRFLHLVSPHRNTWLRNIRTQFKQHYNKLRCNLSNNWFRTLPINNLRMFNISDLQLRWTIYICLTVFRNNQRKTNYRSKLKSATSCRHYDTRAIAGARCIRANFTSRISVLRLALNYILADSSISGLQFFIRISSLRRAMIRAWYLSASMELEYWTALPWYTENNCFYSWKILMIIIRITNGTHRRLQLFDTKQACHTQWNFYVEYYTFIFSTTKSASLYVHEQDVLNVRIFREIISPTAVKNEGFIFNFRVFLTKMRTCKLWTIIRMFNSFLYWSMFITYEVHDFEISIWCSNCVCFCIYHLLRFLFGPEEGGTVRSCRKRTLR